MQESTGARGGGEAFGLIWGPFRVDPLALRVWVEGREIAGLEPLDIRVLGCLVERAGEVWAHPDLLERLYGRSCVNRQAVTRAISRVRRRCDPSGRWILNVYGVGYGLGVCPHKRGVGDSTSSVGESLPDAPDV